LKFFSKFLHDELFIFGIYYPFLDISNIYSTKKYEQIIKNILFKEEKFNEKEHNLSDYDIKLLKSIHILINHDVNTINNVTEEYIECLKLNLNKNDYVTIRNIFNPIFFHHIQQYYIKYFEENKRDPKYYLSVKNEELSVFLNSCLIHFFQKLFLKKIEFAFPVIINYNDGNLLELHCDVPKYTYSMSFCLFHEHENSLSLITNDSENYYVDVKMDRNESILFKGSSVSHYRRKVKGRIISLSFSFKYSDQYNSLNEYLFKKFKIKL
jgi:hypothetical protein